jgi:DNA-binding PadR family transcriptional regulator
VLELAILGLLKEEGDLHGYELKKRLAEALGPLSSVSFGSLYPALSRLERAGAVETTAAVAGAPVPATGALSGELAVFRTRRAVARRAGKPRKVYRVTARGEALFEELLAADTVASDDDRTFALKLTFARYLPPDARLGLFERRRAQLVERLARARNAVRARRERLDVYARSVVDHGTEATEREISWLDRLIEAEKEKGTAR